MIRASIGSVVSNIFITHMHGDHIFGIPAVALDMINNETKTCTIYGPKGIQAYVNGTLQSALVSPLRISSKIIVKELVSREYLPKPDYILPNNRNEYLVFDNEAYSVYAVEISHSVTTYGYVVEEKPRLPKINVEKVTSMGLNPGPLYKQLQLGRNVTLANGTVIRSEDVLHPVVPGRKIVILGDTCDASAIKQLAMNADVVIHETTLPDERNDVALERGHSSPATAGQFARSVNAKQLVITHFGGAAASDDTIVESVFLPQAKESFKSDNVIAAQDFLVIDVPRQEMKKST
jgi:ribonuclease Z